MAENYLTTDMAWYPKEASQFHGRVFMKTLEQHNPDLFQRASQFFEFEKGFLRNNRMQANLSALQKMIEREETKENNLLNDIFQKDGYSAMDAGQRISVINALYATKDQFQRNITKIQAIQEGKGGGGRIDPTTEFSRFLADEINQFVQKNGVEELSEEELRGCLELALKRLLTYTDRKTGLQPYAELAEVMDILAYKSGSSWIIDELFALYFGVPMREVQKQLAGQEVTPKLSAEKTKKSVWGDYFYGSKKGNVMEAVEALTQDIIQKQFGGEITRTGSTGMKADNIITYKLEVDLGQFFKEVETEKDRSVRARSVELLEKMFDKIGSQGGYIVEVSDKNYSLTSKAFAENKGFAAQTNFKLANLEKLLDKMYVPREDINSLMFVLANTDEKLIGGADAEDMCKFVSTYIGYFLFDDLQIDDNSFGITTQAIHLFNLDGVYIPLSVFLRAALYAFENLPEKSNDYVNVTFNSKFNYKNQTDGLQEEDWTRLYRDRINESSLDIHFFGDFVNFIKSNVKL